MNVNSRSNVQGVGALPNRSIAPVLQFMQTFIEDERARVFLNENGTSKNLRSIDDVCMQFIIFLSARDDLFRALPTRIRPENA